MRKLAIAVALASTALATPAVARDNTWYVGVEGGGMLVQDSDFNTSATFGGLADDDEFSLEYGVGTDVDMIGGHDFGMFRAEVEAGYKRAGLKNIISSLGNDDVDGSVRAYSVMGNLLLDFGNDDEWTGYVGGGVGLANVRYKVDLDDVDGGSGSDSDRSIAFQAIAGVRKPISNNLDVGLKYRFFVAPKLDYDIDFGGASTTFRSHSLLASLTYNFAPPPVVVIAPPPPPPPPATQTCSDGSVILATDICPAPPPPPPPLPPEPIPERG